MPLERKDVLVARAFAAYEAQIPEVLSKTEQDIVRQSDYKSLLHTNDEGLLPDPFDDLNTGWIGEKQGKRQWPACFIEDIAYFLTKCERDYNKVSLSKRLLNDYKEQKAF